MDHIDNRGGGADRYRVHEHVRLVVPEGGEGRWQRVRKNVAITASITVECGISAVVRIQKPTKMPSGLEHHIVANNGREVLNMENEKRLIDAYKLEDLLKSNSARYHHKDDVVAAIAGQPTVDAVEVSDKKLLRAIKLLIKQYEHSKQSDYVRNPVAHAFFHTWKQLEENSR